MAYQTADVVEAVRTATGTKLGELRVDGGASVMDVLCQFQADVLGVTVRRPAVQETTALGAAYLAGIAEGIWATPADAAWRGGASFTPRWIPRSSGAPRRLARGRNSGLGGATD
jgi:glycerol kinase